MERIINEKSLREDIAEGIAEAMDIGNMETFLPYVTSDEIEMVLEAMFKAESIEIHRMVECIKKERSNDSN